ncbi:MAG TPA: hypothetical protein PKH31_13440, partial [Candidatus Sumerlaeota bacterium]|nr:hypothetical protein [Candidatus Sumerlaeota bacterium]
GSEKSARNGEKCRGFHSGLSGTMPLWDDSDKKPLLWDTSGRMEVGLELLQVGRELPSTLKRV